MKGVATLTLMVGAILLLPAIWRRLTHPPPKYLPGGLRFHRPWWVVFIAAPALFTFGLAFIIGSGAEIIAIVRLVLFEGLSWTALLGATGFGLAGILFGVSCLYQARKAVVDRRDELVVGGDGLSWFDQEIGSVTSRRLEWASVRWWRMDIVREASFWTKERDPGNRPETALITLSAEQAPSGNTEQVEYQVALHQMGLVGYADAIEAELMRRLGLPRELPVEPAPEDPNPLRRFYLQDNNFNVLPYAQRGTS